MRVTERGAWLFVGERQVALCVAVDGTVDKATAVASLRQQWREYWQDMRRRMGPLYGIKLTADQEQELADYEQELDDYVDSK